MVGVWVFPETFFSERLPGRALVWGMKVGTQFRSHADMSCPLGGRSTGGGAARGPAHGGDRRKEEGQKISSPNKYILEFGKGKSLRLYFKKKKYTLTRIIRTFKEPTLFLSSTL